MDDQIRQLLRDEQVPQYARTVIDALARENRALKLALDLAEQRYKYLVGRGANSMLEEESGWMPDMLALICFALFLFVCLFALRQWIKGGQHFMEKVSARGNQVAIVSSGSTQEEEETPLPTPHEHIIEVVAENLHSMTHSIHMPEESWLAMLEFVPRRVLGNKVDKIGNRYFAKIAQDCLHAPHKHIRIRDIYIDTGADHRAELWNDWPHGEIVPIADVEMPQNIKGCGRICIGNLDSTGLKFLGRMRALFQNVAMDFDNVDDSPYAVARASLALYNILPLISGPIDRIEVDRVFLPVLRDSFPATFFNTKCLTKSSIRENITNYPRTAVVLADWLFTPLANGQPRVLMMTNWNNDNTAEENAADLLTIRRFITTIQQRFVNPARQQASPFHVLIRADGIQTLQMNMDLNSVAENGLTGEQLIMRASDDDNLVVFNCAIGADQQWLAQKEREINYSNLENLHAEKKQSKIHFESTMF